jgi:hypothetical protein
MKKLLAAATAVAAIAASGCVREAQIRMPHELVAQNERIELTGMGGGRSGSFRLGADSGQFTRGADQLAIFDPLVVRNRGGGGFSLSVAGRPVEGSCGYRAEEVNVGPIAAPSRTFAYRCLFARGGRPVDAQLLLHATPPKLGMEARGGLLEFEGQRLTLRSIHNDAKGGLPTPAPLGYVFELDGRAVGAIDLNGPNKTIHVAPGPSRDAVIAGSLALAILWDPAEVW